MSKIVLEKSSLVKILFCDLSEKIEIKIAGLCVCVYVCVCVCVCACVCVCVCVSTGGCVGVLLFLSTTCI